MATRFRTGGRFRFQTEALRVRRSRPGDPPDRSRLRPWAEAQGVSGPQGGTRDEIVVNYAPMLTTAACRFSSISRIFVLSQTAEYALRAIVDLAYVFPKGKTTEQIALATKVPPAYLSKVLQALSRGGLVRSQRGIRGGMSLQKQPSEVTILDVINAVDPMKRVLECPLGLVEHRGQLCALHRRIDEVIAMAEGEFSETTMAQVVAEQLQQGIRSCGFPLADPVSPSDT